MAKLIDLSNMQYGRLRVVRRTESRKYASGASTMWTCQCECGSVVDVSTNALRSGRTRSCGCLHREYVTVHGDAVDDGRTRLYRIWAGMKERCSNPHKQGFHRYGGRGIKVCQAWASDFACFRDWAISHGYQPDLSIDRINNDGDYSPENCRWATPKEQAANRCTAHIGKEAIACT